MSEATRKVFGKDNKEFYSAIDKMAANSRKEQKSKSKAKAKALKKAC